MKLGRRAEGNLWVSGIFYVMLGAKLLYIKAACKLTTIFEKHYLEVLFYLVIQLKLDEVCGTANRSLT